MVYEFPDGSSITFLILPSSWFLQEPGLLGGWWGPATKEKRLNKTSYILIPDPKRRGFRNNKIGRKIQNDTDREQPAHVILNRGAVMCVILWPEMDHRDILRKDPKLI